MYLLSETIGGFGGTGTFLLKTYIMKEEEKVNENVQKKFVVSKDGSLTPEQEQGRKEAKERILSIVSTAMENNSAIVLGVEDEKGKDGTAEVVYLGGATSLIALMVQLLVKFPKEIQSFLFSYLKKERILERKNPMEEFLDMLLEGMPEDEKEELLKDFRKQHGEKD